MFLFLALLFLGIQFHWADLHFFSAEWAREFHFQCLHLAPQGPWRDLYQATVCGKNLKEPEFLGYLKKFGLLHLIVVSGAHLLFLERMIHLIGLRAKTLIYPLMFVFALATLFQPPVTRALVAILLGDLNVRFRFFWHPAQVILLSGVMCWFFFPEWIHSLSFLLSWSCSLIMCLVSGADRWEKHIFVYAFMSLFLLPLQISHPISIVLNMFMAPAIGLCLFPASLIAFVIPWATKLVDPLWGAFYEGLRWLDSHIGELSYQLAVAPIFLWAFLWLVHIGLEIKLKNQ